MVPFYHRIADESPNPWTLSRGDFARHLAYVRKRFDLIGLAEVQQRLEQRQSFCPAVSITFDDGYADNSAFALPWLIHQQVPCTYFVAVENVLRGQPFPHDVANGRALMPNTLSQLRQAADGGIEIGLHTRTHVDCSQVTDPAVLEDEIVTAAKDLSRLLDRPVRYFAFPYGLPAQLTQAAIGCVQRAGLRGFCSAFGGYNLVGQDTFHIRRFHGDEDFARFRNWLDFDTRKLRQTPRIDYRLPADPAPPGDRDGEGVPLSAPVGSPPGVTATAAVDPQQEMLA